jgi:hypothetical protein
MPMEQGILGISAYPWWSPGAYFVASTNFGNAPLQGHFFTQNSRQHVFLAIVEILNFLKKKG